MQPQLFNNGKDGFVIHKITGNFKGKCSAWYDAKGKLIAAEQILPASRLLFGLNTRPVKVYGPLWKELATKAIYGLALIKQCAEEQKN